MRALEIPDFLSKMCHYAQDNVADWEDVKDVDMENLMINTSYQVACFIAQNTVHGYGVVPMDIVLGELCEPIKTEQEWKTIILNIIGDHGGLTSK